MCGDRAVGDDPRSAMAMATTTTPAASWCSGRRARGTGGRRGEAARAVDNHSAARSRKPSGTTPSLVWMGPSVFGEGEGTQCTHARAWAGAGRRWRRAQCSFFLIHKKTLLAYFPPTKHGALPSHIERARRNAAHSRGIFYSNSWLACRCGVTATATRGGHAASHVAPKRLWHEKQLRRAAAACPGSTPHLRTRRAPARARCNARSRSRCSRCRSATAVF